MCQISVCNLNDPELNRKLFLIMGSLGAEVHKDGWGIADSEGRYWKCAIPMNYTSDAGSILKEFLSAQKQPLLGHIRQASPRVPVLTKNAHPFRLGNITFVHNGKLTPKDEKNFVMEEEMDDIDPKTGNPFTDKEGNPKKKKVSVSDSLLFFQEFIKLWEVQPGKDKSVDDHFKDCLKGAMDLFYGKFAFVFIIGQQFYIVRGKTADLYVSYLYKDAMTDNPLGWAVNTSRNVLDDASILLSNLEQIDGRKSLNFSYPVLLKEETIFKAVGNSIDEIGAIKQNPEPYVAPVVTTYRRGVGNFTPGSSGKDTTHSTKKLKMERVYESIVQFMFSYSLSIADIQNIFYSHYSASLLEPTEATLHHFSTKVLPGLASRTTKDIRKALRKALGESPLMHYRYNFDGLTFQYPWMLNSKEDQRRLISKLEEERAERK